MDRLPGHQSEAEPVPAPGQGVAQQRRDLLGLRAHCGVEILGRPRFLAHQQLDGDAALDREDRLTVLVASVGAQRGDHPDVADLAASAQLQRVFADEVAQALL